MLTRTRRAANDLLAAVRTERKPALRRATEDGWLLATDLPLAAERAETDRFIRVAEEDGWRVSETEGGWLLLDRTDLLATADPSAQIPDGEVGALLSLLLRHPSGEKDPEALRAIAKAAEQGPGPLARTCAALHAAWAERLRQNKKLPGALLPYLCAAVKETKEI